MKDPRNQELEKDLANIEKYHKDHPELATPINTEEKKCICKPKGQSLNKEFNFLADCPIHGISQNTMKTVELEDDPIGEITFNGILYTPKVDLNSFTLSIKKGVLLGLLQRFKDEDYRNLGIEHVYKEFESYANDNGILFDSIESR